MTKFDHTVNGEKFAGLNISGFSGIKFFTEIFLTIPKYSVRGSFRSAAVLRKLRKFSPENLFRFMVDYKLCRYTHAYIRRRNQYIQTALAFIEIEIEKAREKPGIKMVSQFYCTPI